MKKHDITIYDIAKETNVSIATVSRVINNLPDVKEETRQKVQKVIEKYDYQPNIIARNLYTKQSKMIGFIIQELTEPFYINVCSEAEKYCLEQGYSMLIGNTQSSLELEEHYITNFLRNRVDGIIFYGGSYLTVGLEQDYIEKMKKFAKKTPFIFINGILDDVDCYVVRTDEQTGFIKMLEYLIKDCGHKNIGMLGGSNEIYAGVFKQKLFRDTLKKHKLEINEDWIIQGGFFIEDGEKCANKLLSQKRLPTAICCFNDIVAMGAMKALQKKGLNVPNDMSVIGFDNIPFSRYVMPEITTVGQNYRELGRNAVQKIIDINADKKVSKESIFDYELMIRSSSRSIL